MKNPLKCMLAKKNMNKKFYVNFYIFGYQSYSLRNNVSISMGDPKSDRWRYLVFQFYYPYIRAVSFSQTALIMIRHRQ